MHTLSHKPLIIIYGPTGVGKSDFAERLASHMPSEIVNMDVGQFYEPLTIGTAKPAWRESNIPHHLFDIIKEPVHFSVTEYREQLIKTINAIWERDKIPLVVGGSGFYLKTLLFLPQTPDVERADYPDAESAWHALHMIDPVRAASIHKHDLFRISRALAIWHATGKKPSEYSATFSPLSSNTLLLFLTRDRAQLYDRINQRVALMMQQGWLEEVAALKGTPWEPFLQDKKIIGYNELLAYNDQVNADHDLSKMVALIAQRTRHYAKRQHTFWRMLKRTIDQAQENRDQHVECAVINLTGLNYDLYIKHLSERILTLMIKDTE
jgi:tRNA dimethylallyltransferase